MVEEKNLEEKIKVISTREMPQSVLDAFLSTNFHGNLLDHRGSDPNDLAKIFNGREILLVTYPLQSDSGHLQWSSQQWYEERGLKPEEYFVVKIDIDQVTDHLRKYWRIEKIKMISQLKNFAIAGLTTLALNGCGKENVGHQNTSIYRPRLWDISTYSNSKTNEIETVYYHDNFERSFVDEKPFGSLDRIVSDGGRVTVSKPDQKDQEAFEYLLKQADWSPAK